MEPWYKVVIPRQELREGRSLDPSEFAVHLEQVVAGTAPRDYVEPAKFFARNYFSKSLVEHCGMVLRRLRMGTSAHVAHLLYWKARKRTN
jgi:predicted AAA+ superfamily ATPase